MSVTIINALPHKKLWNMWIIVSSQQYINTILKILLVMLTLKSVTIMNACDTKQKRWWFSIQILNRKRKKNCKITISRFSGINLSNHKSTKKVKNKELKVQSCNINAIKSDDVYWVKEIRCFCIRYLHISTKSEWTATTLLVSLEPATYRPSPTPLLTQPWVVISNDFFQMIDL